MLSQETIAAKKKSIRDSLQYNSKLGYKHEYADFIKKVILISKHQVKRSQPNILKNG